MVNLLEPVNGFHSFSKPVTFPVYDLPDCLTFLIMKYDLRRDNLLETFTKGNLFEGVPNTIVRLTASIKEEAPEEAKELFSLFKLEFGERAYFYFDPHAKTASVIKSIFEPTES